jgi:hypothetical protein
MLICEVDLVLTLPFSRSFEPRFYSVLYWCKLAYEAQNVMKPILISLKWLSASHFIAEQVLKTNVQEGVCCPIKEEGLYCSHGPLLQRRGISSVGRARA